MLTTVQAGRLRLSMFGGNTTQVESAVNTALAIVRDTTVIKVETNIGPDGLVVVSIWHSEP